MKSQKITKLKSGQKKRGFVAVFTVTMLGFLALIFTIATAPQAWFQTERVLENQWHDQTWFDALSCVNIVRSMINSYPSMELSEMEGEYAVGVEQTKCFVASVSQNGPSIKIQSSATKNQITVDLETEIDASDLRVTSVH